MAERSWRMKRQREAWAHGRALRDRLLSEHQSEYGLLVPPPPAKVIDEILTEQLKAKLRFDPLPLDRFAETRLVNGEPVVTINSDTASIAGVKDAVGVQNVAKWHEAIHIADHLHVLVAPAQAALEGFGVAPEIVCYRAGGRLRASARDDVAEREFWAEEAGRAAAVSLDALRRTDSFRSLLRAANQSKDYVRDGWPRLYEAAEAIGVNISALVKQLQFDGFIALVRISGKDQIFVQPQLTENR